MIIRYKSFSIETDEDVYEPSDDTYLLLDSLEKIDIESGFRVLEVGCGTGIISIALSGLVFSVVACDINPSAARLAEKNVERNGIKNVEVIKSDLFSDVSGRFDLIIFNTPYLPQSPDETVSGAINHAWDGGIDGRKVIDRFLLEIPAYLYEGGCIVFLESSLSDYEKSLSFLESAGFEAHVISRKRLSFEELVVIEAVKR